MKPGIVVVRKLKSPGNTNNIYGVVVRYDVTIPKKIALDLQAAMLNKDVVICMRSQHSTHISRGGLVNVFYTDVVGTLPREDYDRLIGTQLIDKEKMKKCIEEMRKYKYKYQGVSIDKDKLEAVKQQLQVEDDGYRGFGKLEPIEEGKPLGPQARMKRGLLPTHEMELECEWLDTEQLPHTINNIVNPIHNPDVPDDTDDLWERTKSFIRGNQ